MKRIPVFAALFACTAAFAAVGPGENLIVNGRFETDQTAWPLGWRAGATVEDMEYLPAGGPGGLPAVRWRNTGEKSGVERTYRQGGIRLAPQGTYRISGWVRRRNFSGQAGILVINAGWTVSRGIEKIPDGDGGWKRFECEFKGFPSSSRHHEVVVYLNRFKGEIDFADLRLDALDAIALAQSERSEGGSKWNRPRLVPWRPLLCEIPATNRTVEFRFFGRLPDGLPFDGCELRVRPDGEAAIRQPLVRGTNAVLLPPCANRGLLAVSVISRADGKQLFDGSFPYRVVQPACPADESKHVKLNGLVTRLLRERLAATEDGQSLSFSRKGDGWVFIQVKTTGAAPDLKVTLDGQVVLDARYPRLETFRHIPSGFHTLTVSGCMTGGGVRVHAVPEIFNYCIANPIVRENPKFDWDFQERHVLWAVTTLNGSNIPKERRPWLAERGYAWVGNLSANALKDEGELSKRIEDSPYMKGSPYAGVSLDELNFGEDVRVDLLTRSLRHYDRVRTDAHERLLYTWVYGKPLNQILAADFMSACANASNGRGRMLFEAYAVTMENEGQARNRLMSGFRDAIVRFRETYPLSIPNTGVIFGNFMQYPILSLVHHPGVDFKYYLDMQLHLLATDPVFEGIGTVGYWGSYYIDEEHLRWSFALMRHYFVEGKIDRLSDRFGYAYRPGFVRNPDFEAGLADWQATGDVTTSSHKGFGRLSEGRWSSGVTPGDTYAVLKRGDKANALVQKITGLVPGALYRLELMVADADDVEAGRVDGRRLPVEVAVEDAERQDDRSWIHVDKKVQYCKEPSARVNLHHVVFRAMGRVATVRIADEAAPVGARHAVNGVLVCPYYE